MLNNSNAANSSSSSTTASRGGADAAAASAAATGRVFLNRKMDSKKLCENAEFTSSLISHHIPQSRYSPLDTLSTKLDRLSYNCRRFAFRSPLAFAVSGLLLKTFQVFTHICFKFAIEAIANY